jgi:hypothetical protein
MILQVFIAMIAGWINRYQQQVIAYLLEENRTLHATLGGQRIRFTDAECRRLAALAFPIGRKQLKSLATLATPDTLMRWYNQLVAQKFDGSQKRNQSGRPRVSDEIEKLVLQMANDNSTWGYRRIQGTLRNILRRHHIDPAPKRRQGGMSWSQFLKMHWEGTGCSGLFHGGSGHLAWPGHLLRPGGDGTENTTRPSCRDNAPSGRGIHDAMCPAAHRSVWLLPPGQAISHT